MGYPSLTFGTKKVEEIIVNREILWGFHYKTKGCQIYHTLKTKTGHSGGAILGLTIKKEVAILGIHTHEGMRGNLGIFFTKQIWEKLKQFEDQLNLGFALETKKVPL